MTPAYAVIDHLFDMPDPREIAGYHHGGGMGGVTVLRTFRIHDSKIIWNLPIKVKNDVLDIWLDCFDHARQVSLIINESSAKDLGF